MLVTSAAVHTIAKELPRLQVCRPGAPVATTCTCCVLRVTAYGHAQHLSSVSAPHSCPALFLRIDRPASRTHLVPLSPQPQLMPPWQGLCLKFSTRVPQCRVMVQPVALQPLMAKRLKQLELDFGHWPGATLRGAAVAIGAHLHKSLKRLKITVSGAQAWLWLLACTTQGALPKCCQLFLVLGLVRPVISGAF